MKKKLFRIQDSLNIRQLSSFIHLLVQPSCTLLKGALRKLEILLWRFFLKVFKILWLFLLIKIFFHLIKNQQFFVSILERKYNNLLFFFKNLFSIMKVWKNKSDHSDQQNQYLFQTFFCKFYILKSRLYILCLCNILTKWLDLFMLKPTKKHISISESM